MMTPDLHGFARQADVLLTYGWVRSSYAALRNLTGHGVPVWVADSNKWGMCQWSRLKSGLSIYPSHYEDEVAFVSRVAELCEELGVRYVFPSHNETEILARHRALLPDGADRLLPRYEHCELFNNKARAYDLVQSLGVSVPRRLAYKSASEVSGAMRGLGISRVVVKLLTGNSAKGVFYADSPDEAERMVNSLIENYGLESDRYPQVEERVEGDGAGCSVLYWDGVAVADFQHKRLREKIETGGTSTLRESFVHEAMRRDTHKIFSSIGWHGLAMAEYKVCPRTGRHWFIEVNPRMWGSIPFAISSGVEFPYLAWLCATQGPQSAREFYANCARRHPWRGRWLVGDLLVAAFQLAKLRPKMAFRTMFSSRADSIDDFHADDLGAFFGELAYYSSRFLATRSLNPEEKGMVG